MSKLFNAKSLDGRQLYKCNGPNCGLSREPWGEGWVHFSSIKDQEDDPYGFLTFCSLGCIHDYRVKQFSDGKTNIIPEPWEIAE